MKTKRIRLALVVLSLLWLAPSASAAVTAAPDGKKNFDALVGEILSQIDRQVGDRQKLIAVVEQLYAELTSTAQEGFERSKAIQRRADLQSDANLTADALIRASGDGTVVEIKNFVERAIDRDRAYFETYQDEYDRIRFGYERQLATLKAEQSLLKSLRRDLETVRSYPSDKDRALFFVGSVKAILTSLESGKK